MNGDVRDWLRELWTRDRRSVMRLVVVGVIGLGLLVWGSGGGGGGSSYAPPVPVAGVHPAADGPLVAEEAAIDQELTAVLAAVPGAGRVTAAVTLARSASEQYAPNHVPLAEIGPQVDGVVVVATGAVRASVRQELTEAVETLLQIQPYQVLVLPNGGGE